MVVYRNGPLVLLFSIFKGIAHSIDRGSRGTSYRSRIMRKPVFAYAAVTAQLIIAFVFAT